MLASTSRVKAGNDLFRTLGDNGELSRLHRCLCCYTSRISVGLLINAERSGAVRTLHARSTASSAALPQDIGGLLGTSLTCSDWLGREKGFSL